MRPDFFVVGAPKCGTTSVYELLRAHPDLFMPAIKEPNFFADDLEIRSYPEIRSLASYLGLFSGSERASARGDASQFHLYSRTAARNIRRFNPDAKIVILLREPISLMRSLHAQYLKTGDEEVTDFAAVIDLEAERRRGRAVPRATEFPRCMAYLDVATLAPQVERYYEVFDKGAVRVFLLDDLRRDVAAVYRSLLEFLGVAAASEPDLTARNVGAELGPIDGVLFEKLRATVAPDVDRLERLLDRDLTHWKTALDQASG